MSLDERIRQLSETIIQEVRGPIEEALHRLLGEVMTMAAADREQAVQAAVAEAAASQESALAALREAHERDRVDVDALRAEFAREREAAEVAVKEQLAREHDAAVAALRDQLGQERDGALEELRTTLRHEHEAELKSAVERAAAEAEELRGREIAAADERAAADREAAVQAVREEHARQEASAVSAARTAAEAAAGAALTAALAAAEHGKQHAEERAVELERERDQARAETGEARQAVLDVEARLREADRQVEDAHGRLREAEQRAEDAVARLREAEGRANDQVQDAALAHAADRQQDLACADRAVAAFRQIDAARTLSDVLGVLVDQAAAEAGRAAILLARGGRLRGWDARGFADISPADLDVPVEPGSIFGEAMRSGLPVSTTEAPLATAEDGLARALATPPGRAGLAVPIAVGGTTVGILYADEGGDRVPVVPSNWPEIAEILARHAGHRLEVLTLSRAAEVAGRVQREPQISGWSAVGTVDPPLQGDDRREEESARRYARLLISEIKLYNEPAVEQGRQNADLLSRLGTDIERARRLFEEKIPAAVRQRVNCFDEEVIRTLAGGDPGLLGQT